MNASLPKWTGKTGLRSGQSPFQIIGSPHPQFRTPPFVSCGPSCPPLTAPQAPSSGRPAPAIRAGHHAAPMASWTALILTPAGCTPAAQPSGHAGQATCPLGGCYPAQCQFVVAAAAALSCRLHRFPTPGPGLRTEIKGANKATSPAEAGRACCNAYCARNRKSWVQT